MVMRMVFEKRVLQEGSEASKRCRISTLCPPRTPTGGLYESNWDHGATSHDDGPEAFQDCHASDENGPPVTGEDTNWKRKLGQNER